VDNEAVFAASGAERRAFAAVLAGLDAQQLATPSLCGGWDVATVGAHLASAITTRLPVFMLAMVRNRGSFDRANDWTARQAAKRPIAVTIDILERNADSRFTPPGTGPRAPLTDVLVHSGDICRPLGLAHDPPADHVATALAFLAGPRPVGFVRRGTLTGLHLVADDLDVDFGAGDVLSGRGVDLMMAVCGRTQALGQLAGPGVATLQSRLAGSAS
jgi:uncharacterized protein (TIGR03083 family)